MTPLTPNRPKERDIHKAVIAILGRFAPDDCCYFYVPNDGKRSPRLGFILKEMGLHAGVGDIVILFRGAAKNMEVKRPGGVQSPLQKAWAEKFARAGGEYVIVDSIAGALCMLKHWGIIPATVEISA